MARLMGLIKKIDTLRGLLVPAGILFLIAGSAVAQFTSSLQGTVQDPNGGAIGGADVMIVNLATKVLQHVMTDNDGVYHFVSLAPGGYRVTATAKGFSAANVDFTLQTAENRNIPVTLAVGQVSTAIEVTSQAPLLDTSDSRNQLTIDTQALQDLPLPALNPTALVSLTPGVVGPGAGTTNTFFTENLDVSANGRGANGNQYILDGLDITINVNPGVLSVVPNKDALSEMTVQTNTYTVDYGRSSSMQTVMTTRSGTDQYHGFASDYFSYQGFNARGEFGIPKPLRVNPYHSNNMSFGIGGPVIPTRRQHQLFFFFSIEPYRSLTSNGNSVQTFEDPAFVAFAQSVRPNSPEVQLMSKYPPTGATSTGVSQSALQAFGLQNLAANQGCNTPSTLNIPCTLPVFDSGSFNSSSYNNSKQYNVRIDKYFSKDRLYGTVFRDTVDTGGPSIRPAFASTNFNSNLTAQLNETHTFSPTTLNEASFGYAYLQGTAAKTGLFTVPVVNVTGLGVGFGTGFADGQYLEHNYHWRDVLTKIRGAHAAKFGYEGWTGDDVALFAGAYGQPNFQFNNMIDLINDNPYSESSLSYNVVTGQPQAGNYQYASKTWGLFAQDTWKATRTLTLNYGLRYDNFGDPYPTGGTTLANFHPGPGQTFFDRMATGYMKQQSTVFGHDLNWVFSPRIGVAWDPTGGGKWVVRGGFGMYHDWVTLGNAENNLKGNPPGFVIPTFFNNGSTAPPIFGYGTQNKYPFGFPYPAYQGSPLNAQGGVTGAQLSVGGIDQYLTSPLTNIWSIAIERQITSKFVASAGYVGQHSSNLLSGGGQQFGNAFGFDVNAFAGDLIQHPNCSPGGVDCVGTQTRLNPSFGTINWTYNYGISNYSAFILATKGRVGQHGFLTASYTRSSSKDSSQNYPAEYPASRFYGPSPWDAPNRFSLGWSYEIPGFRPKGFTGKLLSGWVLSGTTILQSGNPFTVYTSAPFNAFFNASGQLQFAPGSGDFNADGNNFDYPNASSYYIPNSRQSYINGVFPQCFAGDLNCGPFSVPQVGQEGNEKQNQFRNPGFAETDVTLKKITSLTERFKLELRFDVFNVFNRVNLLGVDNNAADIATFGRSTSTQIPRQAQVAARLEF